MTRVQDLNFVLLLVIYSFCILYKISNETIISIKRISIPQQF